MISYLLDLVRLSSKKAPRTSKTVLTNEVGTTYRRVKTNMKYRVFKDDEYLIKVLSEGKVVIVVVVVVDDESAIDGDGKMGEDDVVGYNDRVPQAIATLNPPIARND